MFDISNVISVIQSSQATLFIMCGFPYAGKSHVVNQIKSHADIMVVSIDDIFKAKGFDWDTNNLPDNTQWQEIFDESYEQVKGALTQGKNVLYDSTNQTVASRDKLREVVRSVGAETIVIYIQCSPETVWKRWEENQKNPNRSVVSKNLVQMTIDSFEVPAEDENVITILND
jgi:predicted kinase